VPNLEKSEKPYLHCLSPRTAEGIIDPDKDVKVYLNLHKKCWSVQQDGRVRAHCRIVALEDVSFKVGELLRSRIASGQTSKTVHAYVVGKVCAMPRHTAEFLPARYNPRETQTFVYSETNHPVVEAGYVVMDCKAGPRKLLAKRHKSVKQETYRDIECR